MTTAARIVVLSVCLFGGAAYMHVASRTEPVPPRESLAALPMSIASWTGYNHRPLAKDILDLLKADEYVDRTYQSTSSGSIGLYLGYYKSQREGETLHSPLNCLPGAGWSPISKSYLTIPVTTGSLAQSITVNRYIVQKGLDQQVVLYWYQGHGRVVANEYASKFYLVYDAIRLNRTDAAIVRVISSRIGSGADATAAAEARAVEFVRSLFPVLGRFLPS